MRIQATTHHSRNHEAIVYPHVPYQYHAREQPHTYDEERQSREEEQSSDHRVISLHHRYSPDIPHLEKCWR